MGLRHSLADMREPWQRSHALLLLPVALIVATTIVDIHSPTDVHLGPTLIIAPALTPSFAGPRLTALVGALAVGGQFLVAEVHGGLYTTNHIVQIITLTVLSALIVVYCAVRDRYHAQLAQVRSVAEAAQRVLLWPLPEQIGPLKVASLYLAAEDEAQIGGDLYATTRTDGLVRVMIGDVRGKGLPAVGEAALLLGAFREVGYRHSSLPELAAALEKSVSRYLDDFEPPEEVGERFATALLVEIPYAAPLTRVTSCGHPPPLLLSPGHVVTVPELRPAPPMGIGPTSPEGYDLDVFSFHPGETLLLYTDGVIEARDADGRFYPLAERVAQWTEAAPAALVHHIRRDLLAHTGGRLDDDAALVALRRVPNTHPGRQHGLVLHADRSPQEPAAADRES
ncbi:serine/threonine-protein phosphatase [Streptomyces sp. RY43-2]|uniref:Serine/threonine-protein phosphatase n=1 Tax=Streptomyces macrolidinus TaxID=2952607 RepID=A0ABT0ZIQ8_9ACTN|nr:PP2C family protein-serine/threonine phosphatase [Streptomyces macrolidinus]MCN9243431.1 serine/threonine-protein phosphatase [Streptomyces macrolidinus]